MNVDTMARRAWPALLCLAIGSVAYFQARGIGALVAAEMRPEGPPPAVPAPPMRLAADTPDADPILERNPFDSEADAQPLVAEVDEEEEEEEDEAPISTGAEPCKDSFTTLVVGSEDPSYSFAAVKPRSGERELVRVGDPIGDRKVARIGWQRVWLSGGSGSCVMKLGEKPTFAKKKRRRRRTRRGRKRRRRRRSRVMTPEMQKKINKVAPWEYQVERSLIGEVMQKQAELLRSTRVRPVKRNGDIVGMRVSRVRKGSLMYEIGLRNGDVVSKINGFSLTDPQKALEAYGRLQSASDLKIAVERKGKPNTLNIEIQ